MISVALPSCAARSGTRAQVRWCQHQPCQYRAWLRGSSITGSLMRMALRARSAVERMPGEISLRRPNGQAVVDGDWPSTVASSRNPSHRTTSPAAFPKRINAGWSLPTFALVAPAVGLCSRLNSSQSVRRKRSNSLSQCRSVACLL